MTTAYATGVIIVSLPPPPPPPVASAAACHCEAVEFHFKTCPFVGVAALTSLKVFIEPRVVNKDPSPANLVAVATPVTTIPD